VLEAAQQRAQEIVEGCKPIIDWKDDNCAVVDGDARMGWIYPMQLPASDKWMWFLHVTGTPNSGTADTLEDAKAAVAEVYGGEGDMPQRNATPCVSRMRQFAGAPLGHRGKKSAAQPERRSAAAYSGR